MTKLLVATQLLLAALAINAWLTPRHLLQWKFSLLALELGHWLALLAIATVLVAARQQQWLLLATGLILASVLLIPAVQASRLDKGMSWARLWFPETAAPTTIERCDYWQSGSEKLSAVVCKPARSDGPLPCIILLHTGGWENGDVGEFESWNRALASHGIVVVSVAYRLAPKHPWPAQRDDVIHAVQWARDHANELGIDPDKLFLMGRSAGGQIASACAFTLPELKVRGCIALYAPHDLIFAHQFSREDDILNALKLLRQYLGGDPDTASEAYHSASAYFAVKTSSPPTLMLHGPRDSLVWVLQSRRLTAKLAEAGVAHEYIELPWAVHACDYFPSSPGGQISMDAVLRFVREHSR
jgi:acetyl esterase/lipase